MDIEIVVLILQQTLIYTVPLLIVALGGMFAERSGVINLALDGQMIFGALMGAISANKLIELTATTVDNYGFKVITDEYFVDHPQLLFVIALLVAGISGALFSLLLSFSAIKLKANQTIGGTALNMLAPAIVCTLGLSFFNGEKVPSFPGGSKVKYVINNFDGNWFVRIFTDKMYISTYILIVIFIVLSIWIYKTKTGMRLRACGEHPQAADSVGINVSKMRYLGTTISGFLAGIGGYAYIATTASGMAESHVAGMGFLALAIMIFGNWKPLGIALGSLMFGFVNCMSVQYRNVPILVDLKNTVGLGDYFYNMLPYLVVLIVLAFTAKKSGMPKAEGIPYDQGSR